jgi:hypothetical protein
MGKSIFTSAKLAGSPIATVPGACGTGGVGIGAKSGSV